jgi:hypothetical protein
LNLIAPSTNANLGITRCSIKTIQKSANRRSSRTTAKALGLEAPRRDLAGADEAIA